MPLFSPYSERRRSMTTEEKNKVLELDKQGLTIREIGKIINRSNDAIHNLLKKSENVSSYDSCPICGKEIINYKNRPGRKRHYCSDKCYNSKKRRKDKTCTCINCGKTFLSWRFAKTKYCSYSCFVQHKYGKRL